jgi:DNA-binding response OmpR family regulator
MSKMILVVEDEYDISEVIREILTEKSYTAVCVSNGIEALEVLNRLTPDLILSDIIMPLMDGIELLVQIHKSPALSLIPFVFLSARTARQDIRLGMSIGADDYLTKPFTAEVLLQTIEARLRKRDYLHND